MTAPVQRAAPRGRVVLASALVALTVLVLAAALVAWLNVRHEAPLAADGAAPGPAASQQLIERGAYLARAGNCAGCHTARGGEAFAGGRGIDTPFGTVYAGNLTPDDETGLGHWTGAEFWRALHHGRSKDGRLLYPAFPYTSYTTVTRDDSDALFAYLRSQPAVHQANTAHALRFPYNLQASLAVWRALFFRPAAFEPQPARSAEWNRGAYLVNGLGHCAACHAPRNGLGATSGGLEAGGGLIPMQGWYAPSLADPHEAGVADWPLQEIVALLKTGVAPKGSAMGPMADVVFRSTQHLDGADLSAIAVYLQSLPAPSRRAADRPELAPASVLSLGETVYKQSCAACHGEQGQGASGFPALAGQRAVTLESPTNVVNAILSGGFAPTTAGNPRPYGMPPFRQSLTDREVAAVATYIRQSWGNAAAPVGELEVLRAR